MTTTIDALRAHAVSRTFFAPTTLMSAVKKIGFLQADPIRAPARAQDLILRHRVRGYHAGDLERRYARLAVEEDFLVNYGFLSRDIWTLMHPRSKFTRWSPARRRKAADVLAFVRASGEAHPRDVDAHFAHGSVTNYWGGSSNATTHLLDAMHYRGLLRVARRDRGVRVYAAHDHVDDGLDREQSRARLDALIDVIVRTYAPVPTQTLSWLIRRLTYATPQWRRDLPQAIRRAKARLSHAHVGGADWYWPGDEAPEKAEAAPIVRLLAPFDPLVWDRRRFTIFWDWSYRFEAYTPVKKRKLGYYALPMLWRDRVVGWGNLAADEGRLRADVDYVDGRPPRDRLFARELAAELDRVREFLRLHE